MRIARIEAHGFGALSSVPIELPDGLVVFMGPNEAGKSSRMPRQNASLRVGSVKTAYSAAYSGKIDRVGFQVRERDDFQRSAVCGFEHHLWRAACFERFLPSRRAQAPSILRLQARKVVFRSRRRQIIASTA